MAIHNRSHSLPFHHFFDTFLNEDIYFLLPTLLPACHASPSSLLPTTPISICHLLLSSLFKCICSATTTTTTPSSAFPISLIYIQFIRTIYYSAKRAAVSTKPRFLTNFWHFFQWHFNKGAEHQDYSSRHISITVSKLRPLWCSAPLLKCQKSVKIVA